MGAQVALTCWASTPARRTASIGANTRAAVRAWQKAKALIPDGYLTLESPSGCSARRASAPDNGELSINGQGRPRFLAGLSMFQIIGIVLLFGLVFGSYIMSGGKMGVILHAAPHEMMAILRGRRRRLPDLQQRCGTIKATGGGHRQGLRRAQVEGRPTTATCCRCCSC